MSLSESDQLDISKLSDAEKRELQQWVNNENQKAKIQGTIHGLTATCFKTCVRNTNTPGSIKGGGRLDGTEEACVRDCVGRVMDFGLLAISHLESIRNGTAGR